MIINTYDYFENCIELQIITITDYDYPRSGHGAFPFWLLCLFEIWPSHAYQTIQCSKSD